MEQMQKIATENDVRDKPSSPSSQPPEIDVKTTPEYSCEKLRDSKSLRSARIQPVNDYTEPNHRTTEPLKIYGQLAQIARLHS